MAYQDGSVSPGIAFKPGLFRLIYLHLEQA
jgi:hypothetical protein